MLLNGRPLHLLPVFCSMAHEILKMLFHQDTTHYHWGSDPVPVWTLTWLFLSCAQTTTTLLGPGQWRAPTLTLEICKLKLVRFHLAQTVKIRQKVIINRGLITIVVQPVCVKYVSPLWRPAGGREQRGTAASDRPDPDSWLPVASIGAGCSTTCAWSMSKLLSSASVRPAGSPLYVQHAQPAFNKNTDILYTCWLWLCVFPHRWNQTNSEHICCRLKLFWESWQPLLSACLVSLQGTDSSWICPHFTLKLKSNCRSLVVNHCNKQ